MYNRAMSKTIKFYELRSRFDRYKKAVKELLVSKYYTESSKSHNRKEITERRIANAANISTQCLEENTQTAQQTTPQQ
jgi:hypothetical protein